MTIKASQSLTPEQLASRVAVLEHVTRIATANAARHREHMVRIGAMTRAIACDKTSVEDRTALVAALEQIADTLTLEAELDVEQLRYANEPHASRNEEDEDELMQEAALATIH